MTVLAPRKSGSGLQDTFVSLVITLEAPADEDIERIAVVASELARSFRFWELVVGIHDGQCGEAVSRKLAAIPNLRLLRVGQDLERVGRASFVGRAIGDVVAVSSNAEMNRVDPILLIRETASTGRPSIGCSAERLTLLERIVELAGKAAAGFCGYRFRLSDSTTSCFPRRVLDQVLVRPDAELLFRFEPRCGLFAFSRLSLRGAIRERRLLGTWSRMTILHRMLIGAAPKLLTVTSWFGLVATAASLSFQTYAALVWLLKPNVAAGWLTVVIALGSIGALGGLAVAALSFGVLKLVELARPSTPPRLVEEVTGTDFFRWVTDKNVEIVESVLGGDTADALETNSHG